MEVEKKGMDESSALIIYMLDNEREKINDSGRHDFEVNLVSPSIGKIPVTISSLLPASPYRHYIRLGLVEKQDITSDDIKARYMHDLFLRLPSSQTHEIATLCTNKVDAKIDEIIAYYDPGNYEFDDTSSRISSRMVMDACYILELIRKWLVFEKLTLHRSLVSLEEKHDLVRLDNQIPFFVLQDIFECTLLKLIEPPTTRSLPKLILGFLKDIIPFEPHLLVQDYTNINCKHILDLVYQCFKPEDDVSSSDRLSHVTTIFSARQLAKAGVKFNPNPDNNEKLDMKFRSSWCNATLTMPLMRIEESTAPVLGNLVAYERLFPQVSNYITSYVFGMKMLLDAKEDVLNLVESKICRNLTGHQYIVDLIHGLCKDVVLTDFVYATEWERMGTYCNSWLGLTRRRYFSGAWSYIASISGLILFFLTAVQTYCSIRAT